MRLAWFGIAILGLLQSRISCGASEILNERGGGRANGPCLMPKAGSLVEQRLRMAGGSCDSIFGAESGGTGRVNLGSPFTSEENQNACNGESEQALSGEELTTHGHCHRVLRRHKREYAGLRCRLVMCDAMLNSGHRRMLLRGGSDADADQRMTGKRQRLR
jgi:hypothetical protein